MIFLCTFISVLPFLHHPCTHAFIKLLIATLSHHWRFCAYCPLPNDPIHHPFPSLPTFSLLSGLNDIRLYSIDAHLYFINIYHLVGNSSSLRQLSIEIISKFQQVFFYLFTDLFSEFFNNSELFFHQFYSSIVSKLFKMKERTESFVRMLFLWKAIIKAIQTTSLPELYFQKKIQEENWKKFSAVSISSKLLKPKLECKLECGKHVSSFYEFYFWKFGGIFYQSFGNYIIFPRILPEIPP